MKLWLSKNSEIPIRDQLVTQITLGIASGDLAVGKKLPSTSEVARRVRIHANTVAHAYQLLAEQGWVEFRKGSGFYVRETNAATENSLEKLIADFLRTAQRKGFAVSEIRSMLTRFLDLHPPDRFVLIEDDPGFREILVEEIRAAAGRVEGITVDEFRRDPVRNGAVFAAMFDEKPKLAPLVPADGICVFLNARSVAEAMMHEKRPTEDDLIAVVSGWEKFLLMAKTMLVAARIDPESLLVRSTGEKNWRKGTDSASIVICDALTARHFPGDARVRLFKLISDDSIAELLGSIGR